MKGRKRRSRKNDADTKSFIQQMNERIGRKNRAYIWKQWKRIRYRSEDLQRLGIPRTKAWEWANTRLGIWRMAGSWVMTRSVTDKQLEILGYEDILKDTMPFTQMVEPPYAERHVRWCERSAAPVRSSLLFDFIHPAAGFFTGSWPACRSCSDSRSLPRSVRG